MSRYSVIPSRHYRSASGRTASIYGATPWLSEAQRIAEGWQTVQAGWTLSDSVTNTVGLGRVPFATEAEAAAYAATLNAEWAAGMERHRKAWEPIKAPVIWEASTGNDGVRRHHSGERYSIACLDGFYVVEEDGKPVGLLPYRTLAKAKAWAESAIRSDRKDRVFGRVEAEA